MIILGIILFILALNKGKFAAPVYLFSYSVWRFTIEFFRGDHRGQLIGNISPSQFWSIILFALGIGYVIYLIIDDKRVSLLRDNK